MADVQRKLTTILAADADGYSRGMEADEVRTLEALRAARGVFQQFIARHHGRIANTAGDGLIAEFPSVVEAVQCAIEVQRELGADARFAAARHLSAMTRYGRLNEGQSKSDTAARQGLARPLEPLEGPKG